MTLAKSADETRSFAVRPNPDGGHQVHSIEGLTAEEAALTFVEHWFPPTDAGDEVAVVVVDKESGRRECFRIDLGSGAAAPCD